MQFLTDLTHPNEQRRYKIVTAKEALMNRTYVCADVHAHLDCFEEALKCLDETDRLFVIGDAVDKGPNRMEVLQKIMDDPRCEMLIGNHDLMMLQYLTVADYIENHDPETIPVDVIYLYNEIAYRWAELNDGLETLTAYRALAEDEQKRILEYLKSCPLKKNVTVNGKEFILVHAAIPAEAEDDLCDAEVLYLDLIQDPEKPYRYDYKTDWVWGRYSVQVSGKYVVTGHTMVQTFRTDHIKRMGDWFDIDCGLAARFDRSSLALFCLDDFSVQYFKPKVL